jgi:subtilisin family serine protease
MVILRDLPLASYDGRIPGYAATKAQPGQKLDITSPAAISYSNYLANQRSQAKAWLASNAPSVQVVWEYSAVLNGIAVKLNGHTPNELSSAPGAVRATNSFLVHADMNRSPNLIGAPALWTAVGGQSNAGAGIKIGILDTGIDTTHPFLTDNSLSIPTGFPKCDARDSAVHMADTSCLFTSNKVLVAKIFCTQPVCTVFDAHAAQDHGSHVSGIAAGVANSCAPFVGCTMSGIAPRAYLGNYNVFPGNVTDASSEDIAMAVDAAVSDGMDVLNLSLGGTPTPNDPLVDAVNAAVDAGLVVAIAAGNAGPGPGTVESPGIAEKVVTVGATTNPHFIGIPLSVSSIGNFGGALGSFNNYGSTTATYSTTTPANGCTNIAENLNGKIALIRRGTCTFTTKIRNAQTAGAIGAIIYNNVAGDPIAMAHDGTNPFPTIPAVMVSTSKGNAMAAIAPNSLTIGGTPQEFFTDGPSADIIAGFSSRGPAMIGTTLLKEIKPDVSAPGVNVYSSILSTSCSAPPCFAFFQGTSMATPHVAGSAAVLKQLHPDWSPLQIKSALVNDAKRPVGASSTGAPLPNPMDRGGGRIDLAAASTVAATIDTDSFTSVNFGQVPAISTSRTKDIMVKSVVSSSVTYSITVVSAIAGPGPTLAPSVTSLTVNAGKEATLTVTLTLSPNNALKDYYGDIVLTSGGVTIQVPYWLRVSTPVPGDMNGDFQVNWSDIVILAAAFDSTTGTSNWNPMADLNNDGRIDLSDAILLLSYLTP